MQILQNFKHNPKINTIFISKVSEAIQCVVVPIFRVNFIYLWLSYACRAFDIFVQQAHKGVLCMKSLFMICGNKILLRG